jgi:hypothetical protein
MHLTFAGAVHTTSGFCLANREFTGRNPEIVAMLNRIGASDSAALEGRILRRLFGDARPGEDA